jgi:SWI/SNF-related matrix-associated actin-dependent regulator of chromatin subfamily A member 5
MVIVPNAAKDQCAAEIRRWTTDKQMPIVIVRGTVAEQVKQITSTKVGWVIGHWESLYYAAEGWLDDAWDYAWLDEVHNIANRRTERAGTVRALRATWRMATSAHPYANGVNELFPVLQFLYPEVYTSFWRWANLHIEIEEGPFGGLDLRTPRRPHLLQWEIEPFRIRRLWKNVWPNLKPVTHNIERVDLTSHGRKEYDRLRKQFFVSLGTAHGERNVLAIPSVLARCTRLRQYLIDPGILGAKEKSIKYPIIAELVKDLCGTPPVIFSMYRQAALRLKEHLEKRGLRVGTMLGGMKGRLEKRKQAFLRGKYDALIVLISVGGQSLNLGKYGKVIYLDHPWTHRDVEQTIGRVRRPEEGTGKLVPVTVYHVVARDSYEVRMAEIRAEKHEDFGKVFSVADATALFH